MKPCPRCGLTVTLHDRDITEDDFIASGLFERATGNEEEEG